MKVVTSAVLLAACVVFGASASKASVVHVAKNTSAMTSQDGMTDVVEKKKKKKKKHSPTSSYTEQTETIV